MKIELSKKEIVFLGILAIFSIFIMFKTFQVTAAGEMRLATKVWSDFAATIPLIRSFSFGDNIPPQYPLFAGPPIRYHFIFYLAVGALERFGLRLDYALNILSAAGFFLLLLIIYLLGKHFFKDKRVGALAVILTLFNGSFSFLEFFKSHPVSSRIFSDIIKLKDFVSFGPYDGKEVSAFWSLNIFTNQRHLAFSYFFFLLLVFSFFYFFVARKKISKKAILAISFVIGLFPFVHLAVFGMMMISLAVFFLVFQKFRKEIFVIGLISLLIALPQIFYMGASPVAVKLFDPGYLIPNPNLLNFIKYWMLNLGFGLFLFPLGYIFSTKNMRVFLFPFLALFVVGYLFRFSPEAAANHKFFNLFLIGANLYSAHFLLVLWKRNYLGKALMVLSFFLLTFSGIIDFFPIVNDSYITIPDKGSPTSVFINNYSNPKSIFLNASYLYDPASMAGRRIYLGWPYFSWSAGYDTDGRFLTLKKILNPKDKDSLCKLLAEEKIDYLEIQNPTPLEDVIINYSFFEENFSKIFSDPSLGLKIYEVKESCK